MIPCNQSSIAAFEDGEETTSQGMWTSSRNWKMQGMDSPLEPPEDMMPIDPLILAE